MLNKHFYSSVSIGDKPPHKHLSYIAFNQLSELSNFCYYFVTLHIQLNVVIIVIIKQTNSRCNRYSLIAMFHIKAYDEIVQNSLA